MNVLEPVQGFGGNPRQDSVTVAQPGGDGGTDESLRVTSKIDGGIFFQGGLEIIVFSRMASKPFSESYLCIFLHQLL